MSDSRPFLDKYPAFNDELKALIKKYDILLVPIIERHPGADIAVIKAVDDNDASVKQKFGIVSAFSQQKASILTH